ncbi:hypothetical protein LX64_01294 [Chitinophaga skermanii]|uniref:Uncharacterized protein n=1 Tax=Chitinophaga skermanii TaxID=331697 RepID=A0A327QWB2_9BACT|nr:hypothetical protein [Chitinophaga skermanii]RAJ08640.1 hypothetical protein LX64_01294 [Chitinophaga skermanii]
MKNVFFSLATIVVAISCACIVNARSLSKAPTCNGTWFIYNGPQLANPYTVSQMNLYRASLKVAANYSISSQAEVDELCQDVARVCAVCATGDPNNPGLPLITTAFAIDVNMYLANFNQTSTSDQAVVGYRIIEKPL